jgi:hypothetical protein
MFLEETEPSAYRIAGPARHFRMSATETERTDDTGRGALYGFLTEVRTYNGEFDPGSGRTLAAGLTHASRRASRSNPA